jgi:membrane dipeptidase
MEYFQKVHKEAIVIAAHTDIVASGVDNWRLQGETSVLDKRHISTLQAGGVTVICDHIGGDTRYGYLPATHIRTTPLQRAMRNLDHVYMEEQESNYITIVRNASDIHKAKQNDKIALVICLEGTSPLEDEISYLRNFHRLGLRMLGLTHDRRNSVAEGVLERSGGGLTYFGVDVVKECNRLGILIDAAHLSRKGIEDVLEMSSHPIIVSHGNAYAVHPIIWNLDDNQIKAIAQCGGVIAVHALNVVVSSSPRPTLDDLIQHITHIAEIGGVGSVGIGPDLMENWQEDLFKLVTQGASKFMSVPVQKFDFSYPVGMSSLAELPNITKGLLSHGFNKEEVTKILGGNCLRLFEKVWGG